VKIIRNSLIGILLVVAVFFSPIFYSFWRTIPLKDHQALSSAVERWGRSNVALHFGEISTFSGVSSWFFLRVCETCRSGQRRVQNFPQQILLLRHKLFPLVGEVKHVNGFLTFRVNQRHLNVAAQPRQR
jgi:hypothetical protein